LIFHATVLEVLLIAAVGAYIGFVIGLRYGVYLASSHMSEEAQKAEPAAEAEAAKETAALTAK